MEGVSSEAASIAGHLKLDNLCWVYDNNHITIDGKTELAYEDDVAARFMGYGWNVARVGDANDTDLIATAFEEFKAEERTADADRRRQPHRLGLAAQGRHPRRPRRAARRGGGARDQARLRLARGRPVPRPRRRPRALRRRDRQARRRAAAPPGSELLAEYAEETRRARRRDRGDAEARPARGLGRRRSPASTPTRRGSPPARPRSRSRTRSASACPGCSPARPTSPTRPRSASTFDGAADFEPGAYDGRQLHYGIREHESAAISNGLSLSKLRPLWSTYLTFSDYARPAIRLSALMELPVIHVFTHDSIGLGEDGPTHQPVEQLASLRAIPGLDVIRPADANEVAEAWRVALDRTHQPVALVLTRQDVPVLDRSRYASAEGLRRGGYVLADAEGGEPEVILIATGSEVALALARARGAERRGDPLARRQPALLGALRPPGPRLPRRGPAAGASPPASRSRRPRRWAGIATLGLAASRSGCTPSAPRRR